MRKIQNCLKKPVFVGAFWKTKNARLLQWPSFFSRLQASYWKVHFLQNFLGLPTLLESKLRWFQRVPLLGTIVFGAFFVTRQIKRIAFTGFSAFRLFSSNFFSSRLRVPSLVILFFFAPNWMIKKPKGSHHLRFSFLKLSLFLWNWWVISMISRIIYCFYPFNLMNVFERSIEWNKYFPSAKPPYRHYGTFARRNNFSENSFFSPLENQFFWCFKLRKSGVRVFVTSG